MDRRHTIGSHSGPSAIRALIGVGKTTTFCVVVFLFGMIQTSNFGEDTWL